MNSSMPRLLANEVLDELDEDDPRAIRSRKDLKRINYVMGTAGILHRALSTYAGTPRRIIEFGAGDGSLMLRLARQLAPQWPNVEVVMLDRQNCIAQQTHDGFRQAGWRLQVQQADIADWAAQAPVEKFDIAIANLFIHHFDTGQISDLFDAISVRTHFFVACEPLRASLPLFASRLVGFIGANEVTRTDAVLSVKAGFQGNELSSLWPAPAAGWQLTEQRAGLFSHLFVARRVSASVPEGG